MVELKHLRFAVLARTCGSFRKTAELVGARHSTLSRSIAELEARIGIALFDRSTRGVQATTAGDRFLDRANAMLEQIEVLLGSKHHVVERGLERLTLGVCTSLSTGGKRRILDDFGQHCRQAQITVTERPWPDLLKQLRSRAIDIVIMPETLSPTPDTEHRSLWQERILVCLPIRHTLAERGRIYWTDLLKETIVLGRPEHVSSLEALIDFEVAAHGNSPKIQRHDVSQSLVYSLVSMGLGISLILDSDVETVADNVVCRELYNSRGPIELRTCARWVLENDSPALSFLAQRCSPRTDPIEQRAVAVRTPDR